MKTITEVWTFNSSVSPDARSWVGYDVEGRDGHIGKIDEMSTEAGRGSLVVDTGFWIFGKTRLLPAASVRSVDHDAKKVFVALTKDQIKSAPDYDAVRRDDNAHYDDQARYYGSHVDADDVAGVPEKTPGPARGLLAGRRSEPSTGWS